MNPYPPIQQKLSYSFDYPVVFTGDLFSSDNPVLARTLDRLDEKRVHRAMVFIDSNVADLLPQITQHIIQYFEAFCDDIELAEEPRILPGGEILKNDIEVIHPLVSAMINANLCRDSFAIVIGGGAVIDTVSFAASIVHRGLRTIRVPTTLSTQINAGLGIKTGINYAGRKNGVGSFAPPFAVISDHQFLYSLSEREWACGFAEALRLSLMLDHRFFDDLCDMAGAFAHHRSEEEIVPVIHRAASLYLRQLSVENQPLIRCGSALDFGHWSAHKLEMLAESEVSYGEAVAMGVLIDSRYATEQGWLPEAAFERLYQAFTQLGLPLWFNELDHTGADGNPEVFHGIPDFQEHQGGALSIPFPNGVGDFREEHEIDLAVMEQALASLKALASATV